MSEVADIDRFRPKKPEMVWECRCGGQHFYLNDDGTIQCRNCKFINEQIEWCYRVAQAPRPNG